MMSKYNRPEIKQITKQWVKENVKHITERDIGLLKLLYENKRRLLRRDQIQILYPYFESVGVLNRRLKILYEQYILDRFYPKVGIGQGSSQQHVCLDKAGLILLDIDKYNKPINYDKNGNKVLFYGWEHKILLNDYECIICQLISNIGAKILIYKVEETILFSDKKFIPDIFILIEYQGKGFVFYIEVDLGTEDIPYIKRKINQYKDYYLSKQWLLEKWVELFEIPTFPHILFLTNNGRHKRIETLKNFTDELSIKCTFGFHSEIEMIIKSCLFN